MKKGFTLVEIMIVVAIIGIIIAIAVPAFLRARENARGRACQENLTKIDGAKEQYALEQRIANGATIDFASLISGNTGYLKSTPACPATTTAYTVSILGTDPICAYSNVTAFTGVIQHVMPGTTN